MAETGGSAGSANFSKIGEASGSSGFAQDTSTADTISAIGKSLTNKGLEIDIENKAIEKEKKAKRDAAGIKISNAFIAMGPQLKQLGQESYNQAQNEVEALREQMFTAIDAKDPKAQADVMIRLNEMKTRHAGDAEGLTTLIDSWESETVSTDAMTEEQMSIMENFASNPTKRVVYGENNVMMYEWDVPMLDENGEPVLDESGEPKMETIDPPLSIQDMQDMIVTKQTENGVKMVDLEQRFKEDFQNNTPPRNAEIKRQVAEIIPMDKKGIRDWLHGNPAEHHGLDVHGYLVDLMSKDFNTFKKLGLNVDDYPQWDTDNNGTIEGDEVPQEFKDNLIKNVMDVKDLEISHDIISEIYSTRIKNNMMGKGSDNKNYHPEDNILLGDTGADQSAEAKAARLEQLTKLRSLKDPDVLKTLGGLTKEQIAAEIGFTSLSDQIFNPELNNGQGGMESIASYIPDAKKATGKTAEDYLK